MPEKRRKERIKVEKLPENLRSFIVERMMAPECLAKTIDASTIGIGIEVPIPERELHTTNNLFLKSINRDFELAGKIRFLKPVSDKECQIGLEFINTKSIQLYTQLLEKK